MSIDVMSWVWKNSKQEGGALLTLLAMADFADDNGICWPSIPTLAKKARVSERQMFRILSELKSSGEIETVKIGGGRKSTTYKILKGQTPDKTSPLTQMTLTPDTDDRAPLPSVSPDPSLNHHDPSFIKATQKKGRRKAVFQPINFIHKEWDEETAWLRKFLIEEQDTFTTPVAKERLIFDVGWWEALDRQLKDAIDPHFLRREFTSMKLWIMENPTKAPKENDVLRFVKSWLTRAVDKEKGFGNSLYQR